MRAVTWLWWLPLAAAVGAASWFAWNYQPADWCLCSRDGRLHGRDVHRHYTSGTYCSLEGCKCLSFAAPYVRRTS